MFNIAEIIPGECEEWTCPYCNESFVVSVEQLPMNGFLNCPYCRREIKED